MGLIGPKGQSANALFLLVFDMRALFNQIQINPASLPRWRSGQDARLSYSLLCVISLYQEYKVGRGTAHYETVARLAAMQHMAAIQATATATSVLSTKRNVTYHVSPPRSPDEGGGTRKNSGPRKHVQFIATHPHRTSRDEEKLHAHWSVAEPSVSDNDSSVQSTSDQTPVWVTGNGSRNGPTCQVHDLAPLILSGHPQSSTRAMPFTTDL
ncbi:hypothetical protein M8J77_014095 [Diaphorina citri]|nr:hypothetical protein M8J77_014095 [Diaphorina citri]